MNIKHLKSLLASTAAFAAVVVLADPAFANGLNTALTNSTTAATSLVDLLTVGSGAVGVGLMGAGAMSLKKHADNPGQTTLTNGLAKLGAGALAIGLAASAGTIQNTVLTGTAAGVHKIVVN